MKLEINKTNNIVTDAFFDQTDLSFSLFINTEERGITPDCEGCGDKYIEFIFFVEETDSHDLVKLIAENNEEQRILDRLYFTLHSKDQLWFLFCDEKVYRPKFMWEK